MATWPSTLPAPAYDGYALSPVDPGIRTDMESGAARTRTRTKNRNDKINVAWEFSDAQMAIFRTWFDNPAECAYGSAWFSTLLSAPPGWSPNPAASQASGRPT
jgi:hypothetical protein